MNNTQRAAALARSRMYKVLADSFAYPREDFHRYVTGGEFKEDFGAALSVLSKAYRNAGGLGKSAGDFREAAIKRGSSPLQNAQEEFSRMFGHTISKECPPYETQYGVPSVQQPGELSKIAGFYRAFGLEARSGAGERLDHISSELEYLQFLCYKEAYALEQGHETEKIDLCVDAQKKFLARHLGKWVFLFAGRLREKAGAGFYALLASLLAEFISAEISFLAVEPEKLDSQELTPMQSLEDAACFSCGAGEESREIRH